MNQLREAIAANDDRGGDECILSTCVPDWALLCARSQLPDLPEQLLERPRLHTRLGDAPAPAGSHSPRASRSVRYVWGPAGTGKSTLVRDWLDRRPPGAAAKWLTLRPGDASRQRFLALLEAALLPEALFDHYRQKLARYGGLSAEDRLWLLCQQVGENAGRQYLVLDRIDAVYGPDFNELLCHLVQWAPANLILTLMSRRPPSSGLEATERLRLLDSRDLALTREEAVRLVALSAGQVPPEPMLHVIWRECDGWLMPIRLFAGSLACRNPLVSSLADVPSVVRFLREQLLEPLSLPEQEALFHLADAELLCDELTQVLLEREGSRISLSQEALLELGIPVASPPGPGAWFRLNRLLRTWITRQSRQGVSARRRFLSGWFAYRGRRIGAAHPAARAGGDCGRSFAVATVASGPTGQGPTDGGSVDKGVSGGGPTEALSDRELAVLALIAQGLSNQAVGDQLHISLHTVKTHARKINAKLGVRSRTQAIVRARALNYL